MFLHCSWLLTDIFVTSSFPMTNEHSSTQLTVVIVKFSFTIHPTLIKSNNFVYLHGSLICLTMNTLKIEVNVSSNSKFYSFYPLVQISVCSETDIKRKNITS